MSTQPHHEAPAPSGGERDRVIKGHTYDGIREYDNPMPGWWLWLFWITVVFAPIYLIGINTGFIDTYEEDLAEGLAELETMRATYAAANPTFEADAATLAGYAGDPAMVEAGAGHYATVCAACHGDQGQGLIGPNLTDEYWLHGGTLTDIYTVIAEGVPAKGMPAWSVQFSPQEIAQLTAYVASLKGTNPPNPKEPQGERVVDAES